MQVAPISDAKAARDYYETRYTQGYMDRWEAERRGRLRDVLATIELPANARILDFGSGSGALTPLLAEIWPDATVTGADISAAAVENANQRYDGIRFEVLDDDFVEQNAGMFDLVFSHHVLEHVFDLPGAVRDLSSLVRPGGRMVHALPCGNPGSLPHWICAQRPGGIDPAAGNRFFFEEASHLRRLRSEELEALFAPHGVTLARAAFGYHSAGALRLFTEMMPNELVALLSPLRCHAQAMPRVALLLVWCLTLLALRAPMQVLVRTRRLLQQVFAFRTRRLTEPASALLLLLSVPALALAPISLPVELLVRRADAREWRNRRSDPAGSEMMLELVREPVENPDAGKAAAGFPQCSATIA